MAQGQSRLEAVRAQAAHWAVRLSDPACTPVERAAFDAWRDADLLNEVAYEREAAAWSELDRLRAFRPLGAAPDADLLAPPHASSAPPKRAQPRHAVRRWAAAAGMALVIGASGVIGATTFASPAYATGVGERRTVVLADGSKIELNTDSKVVVRFRRGERQVELVRGEAMFEVAAESRPFVVKAGSARLETTDSDLSVRLRGGETSVTVTNGAVRARGLAEGARSVQVAAAGAPVEAQIQMQTASVQRLSPDAAERALAWRSGAISLNGQPLSEAAAEFNRYNRQQIAVADAQTGALRLAGYFQTSDLQGFVQAVTQAFPVEARQEPDGRIVLKRAG